jgi:hypothetical protein
MPLYPLACCAAGMIGDASSAQRTFKFIVEVLLVYTPAKVQETLSRTPVRRAIALRCDVLQGRRYCEWMRAHFIGQPADECTYC